MGLNVVTTCLRHKQYNYSMRGEEHLDFQVLMRSIHKECMRAQHVVVESDSHTIVMMEESGYTKMWPYEDRPAATSIEHTLRVMKGGVSFGS